MGRVVLWHCHLGGHRLVLEGLVDGVFASVLDWVLYTALGGFFGGGVPSPTGRLHRSRGQVWGSAPWMLGAFQTHDLLRVSLALHEYFYMYNASPKEKRRVF